jgi:hypothetical protein
MKPKKSKTTSRKLARRALPSPQTPSVSEDLHQQIAARAYEIYERRTSQGALEDWLQAEREILKKTKVREAKGGRTRFR